MTEALPPDATCDECGKAFEQRRINHRFCSLSCQRAWHRRKNIRRLSEQRLKARTNCVCPVCEAVFTPPSITQKFCSRRCQRANVYQQRWEQIEARLAALRCRDCGAPMPEARRVFTQRCVPCAREHDLAKRRERQRRYDARKRASL